MTPSVFLLVQRLKNISLKNINVQVSYPGVRWRGKDEPVKVVPKDSEAVPETSLQLASTSNGKPAGFSGGGWWGWVDGYYQEYDLHCKGLLKAIWFQKSVLG